MKKILLTIAVMLLAIPSIAGAWCYVSGWVTNYDTGLGISGVTVCGTTTGDNGLFNCIAAYGDLLTAEKNCYENGQVSIGPECQDGNTVNVTIRQKYRNIVSCAYNCPPLAVYGIRAGDIHLKGEIVGIGWTLPGNYYPDAEVHLVKVVGLPYAKKYVGLDNNGGYNMLIPANALTGTYEVWVIINDLIGKSPRFEIR